MHNYEIIIDWNTDDRAFIAEAPKLTGCMAHGRTPSEALPNCQEVIDLWLDTSKKLGHQIQKSKGSWLMYA